VVIEHFIVRDQEKAFAVLVKPAYRIDVGGESTERSQRRLLSGELCQNPKGLVNNEVSCQNQDLASAADAVDE